MTEQWYIVPELEVRIHQSWVDMINYCKDNLPYGDIKIQIANAMPTKRLKETPKIRFDKQSSVKIKTGQWYLIPSTGEHIHEYWINLIQWCQNYFVKGVIEFRLIGGQPTELLAAKQDIRFDKPETIPAGEPLVFGTG